MQRHILWYQDPAEDWNDALPVGNGRLGAMIYGKPNHEIIQVNEDSIWSGFAMDRNNPDAKKNLPIIQQLIADGNLEEAQNSTLQALSGTPDNMRCYQTAGDIHITTGHTEVTNYKRQLNLSDATVTVSYDFEGTNFIREHFISTPADVLVMRFTSKGPRKLDLSFLLSRPHFMDRLYCEDGDSVALVYRGAIPFCNRLTAASCDGRIQTIGANLVVSEATTVTLFFDIRTAFRSENYISDVRTHLMDVKSLHFEELKRSHKKDYQSFFNRNDLILTPQAEEVAEVSVLDTAKRLRRMKRGHNDLKLLEDYFHFGRYLLISCSRPGTLPANLQGIWNNSMTPPWGSKFTININTEMNYWFAEKLNFPELHLPLFDLLRRMHHKGKATAEKMYGCHGFVAHHNTDLWGDCAPQDYWLPGTYWVLGGAWLCLHIWEHYEYTKDINFLIKMFPILQDACLFLTEFVIEDKNGNLILSPTASPENKYRHPNGQIGYLCAGCTMDHQIMRELFHHYMDAYHTLLDAKNTLENKEFSITLNEELTKSVEDCLSRLPETRIHSNGTIMEWNEEYEELELGHRHISHLFGLFPGTQITPEQTPKLSEAAKKTLERRLAHGGGHTGWSRAWIINFWARLGEGELAFQNVKALLTGSTLPNLFDNHPPFQIDGNFGSVSGICEMIFQYRNNTLFLLPAFPEEIKDVTFLGYKATYGLTASLTYTEGELKSLVLTSKEERGITLNYRNKTVTINLTKGVNDVNCNIFP